MSRVGRFVVVVMCGIAVGVAGCSSSPTAAPNTGPASTPSAASTPATTVSASPVDTAKDQAKAAYLAMWQDVSTAALTSDWQSPRLADHAAGDALSVISKAMYADHYNGLVTKGAPKNNPSVSSVDPPEAPTTVMISDCGDSTNWLKYKADTGQLADSTPGGRRSITAEVKHQPDGSWKVTRFAVEGLGTC